MPKLVFLATDVALYGLVVAIAFYVWHALRTPTLRQTWRSVLHDAVAMSAAVVLLVFLVVAMLDSLHFRPLLPPAPGAAADARARLLDAHAVGARLAAGRAARSAREVLLGPARHARVLEGVDDRRRQVDPRLSAAAIRRRASQGRRRRMGERRRRGARSTGLARRRASARSLLWLVVAALRARSGTTRRPRRCARSGSGPPKFPGARCC